MCHTASVSRLHELCVCIDLMVSLWLTCDRRRVHVRVRIRKKKQIGHMHHARPRRASPTAPLRTGADMCKTISKESNQV